MVAHYLTLISMWFKGSIDRQDHNIILLGCKNQKTDFHRRAWRGIWGAWPETVGWWRHLNAGVACPNFSLFERRLDGVDRILSKKQKTDFHIHRWSNVLTAYSGNGSDDDVICMAWVCARILCGQTHYRSSRSQLMLRSKQQKRISIDVHGEDLDALDRKR